MEVARGPPYDRRYGGVITIIDELTGWKDSHSYKGKESIILTYGCMRHQDIMLLNEEGPALRRDTSSDTSEGTETNKIDSSARDKVDGMVGDCPT